MYCDTINISHIFIVQHPERMTGKRIYLGYWDIVDAAEFFPQLICIVDLFNICRSTQCYLTIKYKKRIYYDANTPAYIMQKYKMHL
jgi:predicted carbohydrate-binding protein with CBM5 and CBM33 domain